MINNKNLKAKFWLSIFLLFLSHISFGKETSIEKSLIETNKQLSKHIDDLAIQIDSLLSSRRQTLTNQSRVSLVGFTESFEGQGVRQDGHINIDLRFPNLEEKWKLQFSSYDTEDEFEGLGRNRTDGRPQEQKYGTSVAVVKQISNVNVTFRPRIELKDPLVSSFLLRFDHNLKLKPLAIHSTVKLFAHSIDGTGTALAFDFDRMLTKTLLFRWFNEMQYLDRDNIFFASQGPMVLKKISSSMAASQTLSLNSQSRTLNGLQPALAYRTDSYHLSGYRFIFTFSHVLYRNIFQYQISPSLNFNKVRNFKGEAGVLLRTELIF